MGVKYFSYLQFAFVSGFLRLFSLLWMRPWSGRGIKAMLFLFILLVSFLLSPSFIYFWFVLLMSTFWVTLKIQKESKLSAMKYFIFQEISTWVVLLFLLNKSVTFPLLGLIFKMGLPPFHLWLMSIISKLNKEVKFPLVASKLLPGGLSLCLLKSHWSGALIILFSVYYFFYSLGLKEILIMSSGYNISWSLLTSEEMWTFSLIFLVSYLMFIYYFLEFRNDNRFRSLLEYLIVLGLPPSGFFFMKIFMISEFSSNMSVFLMLILLLVFLLFSYLKVFERGVFMFYTYSPAPSKYSDKGMMVSNFALLILLLIFTL